MSGCTRCRWGTNTNSDRPVNTENAKKLEKGLQQLLEERNSLDNIWETNNITHVSSSPIAIPKRSPPLTPVNAPANTPVNTLANTPDNAGYTELTPSKPPTKKNYAGLLYN